MSAEALVLQCVVSHNRPFNVQLVADFLATKGVKKAQCQRSLDLLVASGKLRSKDFGKARLYYPLQDTDILSKEEIASKRARNAQAAADLAALTSSLNKSKKEGRNAAGLRSSRVSAELAILQNVTPVDELRAQVQATAHEARKLEQQVEPLRGGKQTVSAEDNDAMEKVFGEYMDAWQRRKRIFNDIWSHMAEGVSMKEKAVFEEAGIDTDEAMNVSCRTFSHLISKRRR